MAVKQKLDDLQRSDAIDLREVSLEAALHALGDPTRRAIVRQLAACPDWSRPCGSFDLPVTNGTLTHHFATLRAAGLVEQRPDATRRLNNLRREQFDERFPGLLALVLDEPDA